jgi:mRNA-degrading endonuclease RelE of RelBE toxin-antitoxin system
VTSKNFCTVVAENTFVKEARRFWDEKDLEDFITYIALHPLEGEEIQGTGGLRKIRWSRPGRGKRGGVRVIYYFYNEKFPLHLLTVYAKSQQEDLSPEDKKWLSKLAQQLKSHFKE